MMIVSSTILLLMVCSLLQLPYGYTWEMKTKNGEAWVPGEHLFAMSLEDHNDAFSSSAYCLRGGLQNGRSRGMCSKCSDCEWKLREGFTTEEEWRVAVREEMTRVNRPGKIGTWILEAPPRDVRRLDEDFIKKLEASLQLSLRRFVTSESRRARYFVVSGTLEEVCLPLQAAGFLSCTPRPASLRIHPALLFDSTNNGVETLATTSTMDIQVSLAPSPLSSSKNGEDGQMRANALANAWSSIVTTSVGHTNVMVRAESSGLITIPSLTREEAGAAALAIVASQLVGEVDLIYPARKLGTLNKYASSVVQGDAGRVSPATVAPSIYVHPPIHALPPSYPLWDMGIHGEGQVIGVADTGLDWNHCFFQDGDQKPPGVFLNYVWESTRHRKIRQYATSPGADTTTDRGTDHGTHVCGTIAGTTGKPLDGHKGIAYAAKLAFFDTHRRGAKFLAIPPALHLNLFPIPYSAGARIHSNSWGDLPDQPGYVNLYNQDNSEMDRYMYYQQDFVVVMAAGNYGGRGAATVLSPATAKNVITVGASEDLNTLNPTLRKYYLSGFSSRGPTPDGRIKPDVCAPGTGVKSARSIQGFGLIKCGLASLDGTSMAAPAVAGGTALVRQYFMEGFYPDGKKNGADAFIPMGALLKAVVVNSAERMIGREATRQGSQLPNMDQGFGLISIDSTLTTLTSPPARKLYVDGEWTPNCATCPSVNEGDSIEYIVKIAGSTKTQRGEQLPLKITLVWSDYPAVYGATAPLINDLDLTVRDSNGHTTYSNGGSGLDTKNTVEHITIATPRPRAYYTVTVTGTEVFGWWGQPYAIVISGPFKDGTVTKIPRIGGKIDLGDTIWDSLGKTFDDGEATTAPSSSSMARRRVIEVAGGCLLSFLAMVYMGMKMYRSRVGA